MRKYDIVLVECQGAISTDMLIRFPSFIEGDVISLDLPATEVESFAIGFIKDSVADKLNYEYGALNTFVSKIMNDMNLESPTGEYTYQQNSMEFSLLLTRNL